MHSKKQKERLVSTYFDYADECEAAGTDPISLELFLKLRQEEEDSVADLATHQNDE